MSEHVILVAVVVEATNRAQAQDRLMKHFEAAYIPSGHTTEWWIAEDDRRDGSDNDSAVFVKMGATQDAFNVLLGTGLTLSTNDPSRRIS